LKNTSNSVIYGEVGLVINPITWSSKESLADTDQGLGSLFLNKAGVWVKILQYQTKYRKQNSKILEQIITPACKINGQ